MKSLEEAYVDLRSDERRRAHRQKMVDPGRIANSAELLARKGELALERKDGRGAMICFQKAAELLPKDERFSMAINRAKKLFR
jgi:hypothetical protein